MQVVLFVPNWTFGDIRAAATRSVAGVWPPTGLMYVASTLREAGHQVIIEDGAFWSREELIDRIISHDPDVVGGFVIAMFWERTRELARLLKERKPNLKILVGGHAPSALKERCLTECEYIDVAVQGEGEYTSREVLERWSIDRNCVGVRGCTARDDDGSVVQNPPRPLIRNLDELPFPAADLIDLKMYHPSAGQYLRLPVMQVISSRGCTCQCLFCYRLMGEGNLRTRSATNVVDEIEHYVKEYGTKEIKFWDEYFTWDRDRIMDICEQIDQRKLDITFWCSARADGVDEELLRKMKKAGCWCINFGVESAVQKNLNMLRKGLTVEQNIEAVQMTHKAGIKTFCTYIFGIPGETYEEGLETIALAKKLRSYYTEFFPITPFPGADLFEHVEKYGRLLRDLSDTGMLKHDISFEPYTMTTDEIMKLRSIAFRTVYTDPLFVLQKLVDIRSWQDVKNLWNGAISLLSFTRRGGCV